MLVGESAKSIELMPGEESGLAGKAPVCVVIPCYCCSATIGRALGSVAAQTLLPSKVVLVEDASPDDGKTLDELRRLAARYSDVFELEIIALKENGGAGSARNRGWAAARQTYIALLDADDAWHPRKIELQYGWMSLHPEYRLTGHVHIQRDSSAHQWHQVNAIMAAVEIKKKNTLLSSPFATCTVMLKRDLPYRFKEGKRHSEDYLLWLQIVLTGISTVRIDLPLAVAYKADYGADGLSADMWKMEMGELDAYWQLYKDKLLSFAGTLICSTYSLAKYLRRLGVVAVANLQLTHS